MNLLDIITLRLINQQLAGPRFKAAKELVGWMGAMQAQVYLLPAFDEFLISYKNRSAVITANDHKKAISDNGIFRPVVLVNGQISGLWKRIIKKDIALIETDYFRLHNKTEEQLMTKAAKSFGHFSGKKAEIKFAAMPP